MQPDSANEVDDDGHRFGGGLPFLIGAIYGALIMAVVFIWWLI